jgi:predicted alpha/beta superfamily hydrolase
MKQAVIYIFFTVSFFTSQTVVSYNNPKPFKTNISDSLTIGAIQRINSTILNEEREIVVSLPKDYANGNARYSVLYLTDGFQNIEHVRGSVELLSRTGHIPSTIIVGIKSINRVRDFTFRKSERDPESGGGNMFLSFIKNELIPYIDKSYRTNDIRILEGHSLGGLFAATILLEHPHLFSNYIIMSPALWWNGEELTQKAITNLIENQSTEKMVFFGIGKEESGAEYGMRKELTNFIDVLKAKNIKGLNFMHKEFDGEGHISSPLQSNYFGLKHVFSDLKYSDSFISNFSIENFLKEENKIIAKYGDSAKRTGEAYYNLGAAIYKTNLPGAIRVFKRSVEVYPYDINLITTLAKLQEKNKATAQAIKTYKIFHFGCIDLENLSI